MTKEELRHTCGLYKISESVGPILMAPFEDPTQPPNGVVVVADRMFKCSLTVPFPLVPGDYL